MRKRGHSPFSRLNDPVPHARVLSNGAYTVLFTGAGSGYSACRGSALTSWSADRTEDRAGLFVYLRDLERGAFWSAGHQPVCAPAESYEAASSPGKVRIERLDHEIATRLEVCVDPERDLEIRTIVLENRSSRPRTIEVTSYAEIVVASLAAHHGHPAFSKLFVQTEFVPEAEVLLASRRPRGHDERRLWLAHGISGGGALEYETDRVRFIGRGGSLVKPLALASQAPLSATVGNVLDPVFALRRVARLDRGASARFDLLLSFGESREAVLAAIGEAWGRIDDAFARAGENEAALRRRFGVSDEDAEGLQELAGRMLYGDSSITASRGATAPVGSRTAYLKALGVDVAEDTPYGSMDHQPEAARCRTDRFHPAGKSSEPTPPATSEERLLFDNGYGGFTADGSEYAIRLGAGRSLPPMPWVNVIANERFGFLASETGAGCTWAENSRLNRLTAWSNDPVIDPHSEALYVRDEEAGIFWSPLPGPVADGGAFEVRHGLGYSRWRHSGQGLGQEVLCFVPERDPVKITLLKLENPSPRSRRVSVFCYQHLVLGGLPAETARSIVTEIDGSSGAILARNPDRDDLADRVTFAAAVTPAGAAPASLSADRTVFLGRNGSVEKPAAVAGAAALDGRAGAGLDPCAALQVDLQIPAGATIECAFLLGETSSREEARALIERCRRPGALHDAFDEVRAFWRGLTSAVRIDTPAPAINLMINGWLVHQLLSCRLWGRSAFYQSGGAFGFRDQLQDSAALVYTRPDLMRAQILLHAAHQFVEGDVLHWWHPPAGRGTRTRCSDDLLWLPYLTAFYTRVTGDWTVLDEPAGFLAARPLEPGEDETYLLPRAAGESAAVYAHCCRAIDRSLARGAHGLPLIGTCDWNDGMNRVGREGRGESVWLGFFLYALLGDFLPICERRGDAERARRYWQHREDLQKALEDAGWDGAWYRRAYYDDGTPLGSAVNEECRIDALAQAWAVISKAAPLERATQAMAAAERELVSEEEGLIRLLTPPFDRTPHDPGYIKGYVPGIRENGGQYTHGALWMVRAFAELGRRDRAAALLEMLTPVAHARDRARVDVYKVEPYVVAADVYGADPHVGRGGWTWYTGSAAWMYRVALESVLGFTVEGGKELRLKPCIPDHWREFRLQYRLPDGHTGYEIIVENPEGVAEEVTAVTVDGSRGTVNDGAARIPLMRDGRIHHALVSLGVREARK